MAAVIGSGTNVGAGTIDVDWSTSQLKLRSVGTTDAVVKLNGFSVTLRGTPVGQTPVNFETFDVDCPTFEVVSGNIDWVALA